VCVGVTAVAVAGPAVAATSLVTASGPAVSTTASHALSQPAPRKVNLHQAFEAALGTARSGPKGGVVPSRNTASRAAARAGQATASCKEPNCYLSYGGGPVQHSPKVYVVLWGANWPSNTAASSFLSSFYSGLGVTPDDSWSTVTSQYGDGTGTPGFGPGTVYAGAWNDTGAVPNPVTENDLAAEADAAATHFGITDKANAQVIVAAQQGTCFNDGFAGSCGTPITSGNGYCGWHAMTNNGVAFTNLPYQPDAGQDCGQDFINFPGTYDGYSIVGGHEYAETINDPNPPTGWIDPADENFSGGEIADKCVWGGQPFKVSDPAGNITLSTGTFAMQSLWSNAANACVMLPVVNPGSQSGTLGNLVDLPIVITGSSSTLAYSATGLPPGLTIDPMTGHIKGTLSTTAGTWHPTVKVAAGGSSGSVSFTWQVKSGAGLVRGFVSKCVDDFLGRTANGTKVDLWGCNSSLGRQKITFLANGELKVSGKCITNKNRLTVLEPCTGAAAQIWTRRANSEYVVRGGLCLTVSGSTANGAQLRLAGCSNSRRQHWSLP
jgi:hypothetical protein